MCDPFSRTRLVYGDEALQKLFSSRVAVFGLGGVGGYVAETLARAGVGALDLVDNDKIAPTNLNRQILATRDTIGVYKTEAAAERIRAIRPDCAVTLHTLFFVPENADAFPFSALDYAVDAVDTVSAKLALAQKCAEFSVPLISCMGTGNKTDPSRLEVADISETSVCPLARVMRRELKKRGIERLKVVYSREPPVKKGTTEEVSSRRDIPGSTPFVPAAAGILLAAEVVKDLIARKS